MHGGSSAEAVAPGCDPGPRGFESRLSPDDYWLAGLLEGQGQFHKVNTGNAVRYPEILFKMTDRDVIERVADLWGNRISTETPRREGWKSVHRVNLRGCPAVDVMLRLRPIMGQRRQEQIDRAIDGFETTRRRLRPSEREEIARRLHAGERAPALAAEYRIAREHVYRLARAARGSSASTLATTERRSDGSRPGGG